MRRSGAPWGRQRYRTRKIRNRIADRLLRWIVLAITVYALVAFGRFIAPWLPVMWEAIRNTLW